MADHNRPDVTEMTAVHRVFTQALAGAPRFVGGVADGDTTRANLVGGFYNDVVEFLRVHHEGEDELMFPRLMERAADPDLVARVSAQHHDVERALAAAKSSAAAFRASGSTADGAALLADLEVLNAAAAPHLADEEQLILPIVEQVITPEEWDELPGHAMQTFKGEDIWLIIGLVREQFTAEQNERMLAAMPPPVAEAWRTVGLEAYKAKVAALVGS